MLYIVYSFFQEFIIPIIIDLYFLGLVKIIKGICLDKLCFYNYPVVKTKSDNNNNNNNNNNNIYIYIYIEYICYSNIRFNCYCIIFKFKLKSIAKLPHSIQ